jgi:flagellar motor switch protein FliG
MSSAKPKNKNFDGIRSAAAMMNAMEKEAREKILVDLARKDPEIARKIRKEMFVFDDLCRIKGNGMQTLLSEFSTPKLILAMRNASDEFKAFVFRNMSGRAAQILREEIDSQGPRRLTEVTAAQSELMSIAKRLIAEGKIFIV